MIDFKATDAWYKKAAEDEVDIASVIKEAVKIMTQAKQLEVRKAGHCEKCGTNFIDSTEIR